MADAPEKQEKKKRFRSPPYPAFDLNKAVERTSQLFGEARDHPVGVSVLANAWSMESVSGQVWRTAAALIQYGLLTDSGAGKSRKFSISDIGRRIIKDTNPDSTKRKKAVETAALRPMIHKELWDKFQSANGLADSVIKIYLTLDRAEEGESPYSDTAAEEVLQTYRATLAFAGITDSDSITGEDENKENGENGESNSDELIKVAVGNYVKWTSDGIDQFKARKVEWISEDGSHLRVFGSPIGIKMSEVTVVDPPAPPPPGVHQAKRESTELAVNDINVFLTGKRLQITADIDADGIKKLRDVLAKYEEILKLLSQPVHGAHATEYTDDEEGREGEQRDRERAE